MKRGLVKVLQVTTLNVGGAWKVVERLHASLKQSNIDSDIFVLSPKENWTRQKIYNIFSKVDVNISTRAKNPLSFSIFRPIGTHLILKHFISRIRSFTVIHIHWIPGFLLNHKMNFEVSRIIWTIHDLEAFTGGCHQNYGCLKYKSSCSFCPQTLPAMHSRVAHNFQLKVEARKFLENITLVAPSNWLATQISTSLVFSGLEVSVIGNPIPSSVFNSKGSARKYDESEITVGILGSNYPEGKGVKEALILLGKFSLTFQGKINVVQFGVPHREISGFALPEDSSDYAIADALKNCDFFFYYSKGETFGNFVAEAAACGVIVVSSAIGAVSELIADQKTGLVVDINQDNDIHKLNLLASNVPRRMEIGRNAEEFIKSNFDSDVISQRYAELYERVSKN